MKIGYRTVKTALGAPIAIYLAQLLQLEHYASAGILAILCIQVTRKKSFLSAWHRFAACLLAMILSYLFFEGISYSPIVIGAMLFVFIPLTVWMNITPGIVTSSVIILHLYGSEFIGWETVLNELLLMIIGIGTALLLNLYMPSQEKYLKQYQTRVERNFALILKELAAFLRNHDEQWTGKELTETAEILEKAKSLALRDVENHVLQSHHSYYHYFQMRTKQFELLERMLPLVSSISSSYGHGEKIADFFEDLSEHVHPGNTAILYLKKLKQLKDSFRADELPVTREEFEVRASLFHLINEIEDYLIIKRSFKKSDV